VPTYRYVLRERMIRPAILCIATPIFMVGLIIMLVSTTSNPPSMAWMAVGCYLVMCGIASAVLVTCFERRIRPKETTEETEPLTTP